MCAFDFFKAVSGLMEGLSLEATKVVLHSINIVFKCAAGGGVEVWAEALDASEVFVRLLEGIGKPVQFSFSLSLQTLNKTIGC